MRYAMFVACIVWCNSSLLPAHAQGRSASRTPIDRALITSRIESAKTTWKARYKSLWKAWNGSAAEFGEMCTSSWKSDMNGDGNLETFTARFTFGELGMLGDLKIQHPRFGLVYKGQFTGAGPFLFADIASDYPGKEIMSCTPVEEPRDREGFWDPHVQAHCRISLYAWDKPKKCYAKVYTITTVRPYPVYSGSETSVDVGQFSVFLEEWANHVLPSWSQQAADEIRRAIDFLSKHNKPVVVSQAVKTMEQEGYHVTEMCYGGTEGWRGFMVILNGRHYVTILCETVPPSNAKREKQLGISDEHDSFSWEAGKLRPMSGTTAARAQMVLQKILANFTITSVDVDLRKDFAWTRDACWDYGTNVLRELERRIGKPVSRQFSWDGEGQGGDNGWYVEWGKPSRYEFLCVFQNDTNRLRVIAEPSRE
jgi:hypothetical protein